MWRSRSSSPSSQKDFPIHSLLPFLQNKFFEPRKVSWVFDLVLDNFCINELPMLKMQGIEHVCFYKRILLSSLVIPFLMRTAWLQIFLRAIRNSLGDMKILPWNNLGNSFNFCRYESILQWEPSFRPRGAQNGPKRRVFRYYQNIMHGPLPLMHGFFAWSYGSIKA